MHLSFVCFILPNMGQKHELYFAWTTGNFYTFVSLSLPRISSIIFPFSRQMVSPFHVRIPEHD